METIKIQFCDFWPEFDNHDNYFTKLLSEKYHVQISEKPDILFYSCFGSNHFKYNCIRIFYTGENVRPDFTGCDYAMTFDHIDHHRHFRVPYYSFYITNKNKVTGTSKTLEELTSLRRKDELEAIWKSKSKFCCMVVSNGNSKKRLNFFKKLSTIKQVDSGGRIYNNVGGPVKDKINFIKDYKFVLSFENASYPGYVTEKIIEPFFADCIPVYWGDPLVGKEFNSKRFLNYSDFVSEDALISKMLEIDKNPDLAIQIISEPVFLENTIPENIKDENILKFLSKIISTRSTLVPVARTHKKYLHVFKEALRYLKVYMPNYIK